MNCYTRKQIEAAMAKKGYKYFKGDNYDVNIIGVRNSETGDRVTNRFDDCLTLSYKVDGDWKFHCIKATSDPGDDWKDNPINSKGAAILVPGQYRGSHKLRLHQGKYLALGQKKNVKVYRDRDKDGKYDFDKSTIDEGLFGINIHRATKYSGKTSTYVDKWSAGCQVIASNDDWHTFLDICQTAREHWGNSFTYTLLESKDID